MATMTESDASLAAVDPEIAELIGAEAERQSEKIRLIPSENYVSKAVLEATASVLTNKYSEGYPGRRYYEGNQIIDKVEQIAIDRAKGLFGADHVNVQPYSGSPANLTAYFATISPGDTIMGMALPMGGHLTHGAPPTLSGKWFNSVQYGVRKDTGRIDMDQVRDLAREHKPKIIVCGGTAIPRIIDFATFAEIAKEVGAILLADMAHIAGLVAGGAHPTPIGHAQIVTTTTHKTLRGPRGAMILCDEAHAKAIDSAIIPGTQGGPHNHTTAAIAVCLKEAATADFKGYAGQIVENAKAMAEELTARGFDLVSGGTDNHLILVDLTSKGVPGKPVAKGMDRAGLECNFNAVPFDPRKPFNPSGIRLGTPAVTSRGMGPDEMRQIAAWIDQSTDAVKRDDGAALDRIFGEVKELTSRFPAPGIDR